MSSPAASVASVKEEGQAEDKEVDTDDVVNVEEGIPVDEGGEEMEELEIFEGPGSVHKPPDGDDSTWCIIVSCSVIKICLISIQNICDKSVKIAIGDSENKRLQEFLVAAQSLALPLIGILMTQYGYRAAGGMGCLLTMVPLFALAWVPHATYPEAYYSLYCIAGVGFTFMNMTSIVPMLEYFQRKRMLALFVYSVVTLMPRILFDVVLKDTEFSIELAFTIYQLIAMTTAGIACSSMVPLTLDVELGKKWMNRIIGLQDLGVMKDTVFYLLLVFVFLFYLGKGFGDQSKFTYPGKHDLPEEIIILLAPLLGELVGFIWAVCLRNRVESVVFQMIGIVVLLAAVLSWTVVMEIVAITVWSSVCFGITGVAVGLVSMSTHKVLPDLLGKQNTRLVAGMVACMASLPRLIESLCTDLLDSDLARFILAGVLILSAGVCALILQKYVFPRNTQPYQDDGDAIPTEGDQEGETTEDVVEDVVKDVTEA